MTGADLETAAGAARSAWRALRVLLDRHELDLAQVPLLAEFPPDLAAAYSAWEHGMNEVSACLASLEEITSPQQLSYDIRLRLTLRAWALVMAPRARRAVHEHVQVTGDCPLACLGLSTRAYNPLRAKIGTGVTVGDVLDLLEREVLGDVRGIGCRRVEEIVAAMEAAGFHRGGCELGNGDRAG